MAKLNRCYVPLERIGSLQAFALNHNIKIKTCFTLGIPGEDANIFWGQAFYIRKCIGHNLPIELYTAEMHPASNLFCTPEQFHVSSHIRCFMDYYQLLRKKLDKSMILGYSSREIRDHREQFSVLHKVITQSRKRTSAGV